MDFGDSSSLPKAISISVLTKQNFSNSIPTIFSTICTLFTGFKNLQNGKLIMVNYLEMLMRLQGKAKKTRKFAQVKRILSPKDARL